MSLAFDLDRRGVDVVRFHDLGCQVALEPSDSPVQLGNQPSSYFLLIR